MIPSTLLAAFVLLASTALGSTTWYVDAAGCPRAGSGTQTDPFCKIQEGIDAADDGDVVLVLPGLYLEHIYVDKAISVLGRDGPAVTVIDGGGSGVVASLLLSPGLSGELSGFTITHGSVTGVAGGVYAWGAARITHNIITGNDVPYPGGGIGGVWAAGAGVLVEDNVIEHNGGYLGIGGIGCQGPCTVRRNKIVNNCVSRGVGGLSANGESCVVMDNEISFNCGGYSSELGDGGVDCGDSALLEHNRIVGNVSYGGTAGVSCWGPVTIRDNLIADNHGDDRGLGGGILCTGDGALIEGNRILGNRFGGIACNSGSAILRNNVIAHNVGSALEIAHDFVATIVNDTIAANDPSQVALILGNAVTATVVNTIFWDAPWEEIRVGTSSQLAIRFSDLDGGQSSIWVGDGGTLDWGPGMIDEDPAFGDPNEVIAVDRARALSPDAELHLGRYSPCINRGDPAAAPATDIDGEARPSMGTADIGADEFSRTHTLAADRFALPAATGGQVSLTLDASVPLRGQPYVVLASVSGTNPGTPIGDGRSVLPINCDAFTSWMIRLLGQPPFPGFAGSLDQVGRGTARFDTLGPMPPESVGLTISFAYLLVDGGFASNPINVEIAP